ncbi:MAG: GIY-YIG nuclease family protein [Patescibacteria group bacterium]
MFYTYILLMKNSKIYTGYTSDLKRRLIEHKNGGNNTTKKFLPVKLISYEAFLNKNDAKRRKNYFKTSKGKTTLKLMLKEFLKRVASSAGRADPS